MISYLPFWRTLRIKKSSTYVLMKNKIVTNSTIQRMRNNDYISTRSINDLCKALDCRVEDILEYIDENDDDAIKKYTEEYRLIRGTEPDLDDVL